MKSNLVCGVLLVAACCVGVVHATYGVDISQPTAASAFSCLVQNGYNFAIVRGYEQVGQVDSAVFTSVPNAWAGGMAHVDIYFYPAYGVADAAGSVKDAVTQFRNYGLNFGMLWFDIEGPADWDSDCNNNYAYLRALVDTAQSMGVVVGIYTSASQWNPIMCGQSGFESIPLWYAHYDGNPSYSDFAPFGGWNYPAIKQWQGTNYVCGAGIDSDWYPDSSPLFEQLMHN